MIDWKQVEQEAADLLVKYIDINTLNPPGNEAAAADFLAREIQIRGMECEKLYPDRNRVNLISRLPGTGNEGAVILLHHMDTVPADHDKWKTDPYKGTVSSGFVFGRGALDMKGAGVMHLTALNLMRRYHPERTRDIILLAVADEETGGKFGTQWLLDHHPEKLEADFVWDEGGFGLKDFFGATPVFTIAVGEKQELWLELTCEGEPGHGGMPRDGNPAEVLTAALARLLKGSTFTVKLHPIVRDMFRKIARTLRFPKSFLLKNIGSPVIGTWIRKKLAANAFITGVTRNTMSITALSAGSNFNMIPGKASAKIDLRLLPGENPEALILGIKKRISDPRVTVSLHHAPQESDVSSRETPFYRTLESVIRDLFPGAAAVPMITPGTTDSCFFRRKGIPAYGLFPALITPEDLAGFHGHNERISLENLKMGSRMVYEVLRRLCTQ
jgi:acetylornithine deacetylase/succinyl-diaminopimelate desuccinylase-like protein